METQIKEHFRTSWPASVHNFGIFLLNTSISIYTKRKGINLFYICINSNQLMHISVFIKNTLKIYLKFLLPRHVSDHIGIHPQGAIIRS